MSVTGILLNHQRSYPSSTTSSSSSSHPSSPVSSDSDTQTHQPSTPSRRIRFAPLPEPRRDDPPIVLPDESNDDRDDSIQDNILISSSPLQSSSSLPKSSSSSSWSTKKLLRSFYKPSSKKTSNDSSLGLFRPTSRDSTASITISPTSINFGSPLKRSVSAGSSGPARPQFGHPLTKVASENYGSARTRMLNGRVYGGARSRPSTSPATTTREPEFVEWGYGGMGSRQSAQTMGSSFYSGVQSSDSNAITGSAAEEDDGSGMGWVKRRREAREKERREREEQENLNVVSPPSPQPDSTPLTDSPRSLTQPLDDHDQQHHTRAVKIPPSRANSVHSHHPRLPPSRQNTDPNVSTPTGHRSGANSGAATPTLGRRSIDSVRTVTSQQASGSGAAPGTPSATYRRRDEREATLGEETEEEEESTSTDRGEYEDDDEDDQSEEEKKRVTALCAGVEKISRHK